VCLYFLRRPPLRVFLLRVLNPLPLRVFLELRFTVFSLMASRGENSHAGTPERSPGIGGATVFVANNSSMSSCHAGSGGIRNSPSLCSPLILSHAPSSRTSPTTGGTGYLDCAPFTVTAAATFIGRISTDPVDNGTVKKGFLFFPLPYRDILVYHKLILPPQ